MTQEDTPGLHIISLHRVHPSSSMAGYRPTKPIAIWVHTCMHYDDCELWTDCGSVTAIGCGRGCTIRILDQNPRTDANSKYQDSLLGLLNRNTRIAAEPVHLRNELHLYFTITTKFKGKTIAWMNDTQFLMSCNYISFSIFPVCINIRSCVRCHFHFHQRNVAYICSSKVLVSASFVAFGFGFSLSPIKSSLLKKKSIVAWITVNQRITVSLSEFWNVII